MFLINAIGMYRAGNFFFALPSSPQFCLFLKKRLFYLGCTTCVPKAVTSNRAQIQLHEHKHLWFLMSCGPWVFFFLGSAGNALMFSRKGVLGLFEDYHFPFSLPGSELLSACADVHVSVKHINVFFSLLSLMGLCHSSLIFFCVSSCQYIWIELITMLQIWQHLQQLRGLVS